MRDIKFRAWDVESNEMTLPNDILEVLVSMKNEVYAMVKGRNETLGGINRDNTILMQYTGLKDRNGTEIYEGDVLKWGGGRTGISKLPSDYIIEVLKSKHLDIELEEHTNSYMFNYDTSGYSFPGFLEEAEIVGNIYENPELLEETE